MEPNSYETMACHEQDSSLNDRQTKHRKQANATCDIIRWMLCNALNWWRGNISTLGAIQSSPHSGPLWTAGGEEQQGALPLPEHNSRITNSDVQWSRSHRQNAVKHSSELHRAGVKTEKGRGAQDGTETRNKSWNIWPHDLTREARPFNREKQSKTK